MMFARQLIKNLSSSLSQPTIVTKHKTLCTLNVGGVKRFQSTDHKDPPCDDNDNRVKLIMLELENLRDEGRDMPDVSFIKKQHWKELLTLSGQRARQKFYHYLYTSQRKKETEKVSKRPASGSRFVDKLFFDVDEKATTIVGFGRIQGTKGSRR